MKAEAIQTSLPQVIALRASDGDRMLPILDGTFLKPGGPYGRNRKKNLFTFTPAAMRQVLFIPVIGSGTGRLHLSLGIWEGAFGLKALLTEIADDLGRYCEEAKERKKNLLNALNDTAETEA